MKGLHARARAEEAVFANRETQEFFVQARAMRRLGEWAARQVQGEDAVAKEVDKYAEALVRSGVAGTDAFENVCTDLEAGGVEVTRSDIKSRFDGYLSKARLEAKL